MSTLCLDKAPLAKGGGASITAEATANNTNTAIPSRTPIQGRHNFRSVLMD